MTKNRVLDELRARERRPQSVLAIEDVPRLEIVDPPVERLETIEAVWRAVRELNPDLKMALLLRDVAGMPYNEIADSLEVCRRFPDLAGKGMLSFRLDTTGGRYIEGLDPASSYAVLERFFA